MSDAHQLPRCLCKWGRGYDPQLTAPPSLVDLSLSAEDQEDISSVDCSNELALTSFPLFNKLRQSDHLCDVTLAASDGSLFRAHKLILAATIPFFQVMFSTQLEPPDPSGPIALQNIEAETLEAILQFIYTGRIRFTSAAFLASVLRASDYLQLTLLSDRCVTILKSRVTTSNVLGVRSFAITHNSRQAIATADKHIKEHFESVAQSEEWLELDFPTLKEILSWDDLHVESEERICEAAMRWLGSNPSQRRSLAPLLLTSIRMPLLAPAYLMDLGKHPLIHTNIECRDLLDEATHYHLLPERRALLNSFNTTERVCSDVPGLIYAVGGLMNTSVRRPHPNCSAVEMYDPLVGRWRSSKPMLTLRTRVGVGVVNRRVFVIGGYSGSERLSTVEVFNPITQSWMMGPPLHQKRSAMCVATLSNHIYVCGGYDGRSALSVCESFDVDLNRWSICPPMQHHRCAAAAAVLDGCLYVMGGHNGVSIFNSVERYNPLIGKWESVAPMSSNRCRLGAAAFNGRIIVAGGYTGSHFVNTCEAYDPLTNAWTPLPSMNIKRARLSLVANGQLLYAIGGYDGESNLTSCEIYSPTKGEWDIGPTMQLHEGGVGVGVIPVTPPRSSSGGGTSSCSYSVHLP